MHADYKVALKDRDSLVLTTRIAVARARQEDLLSRVDTGEAGEIWRSLRQTFKAAEKALLGWNTKSGDDADEAKQEFFQAYETIGGLISEGVQDYQAWDEYFKLVETERKLNETEVKRIKAGQESLTNIEAIAFAQAVHSTILKHVKDRVILSAIAHDLTALTYVSGDSGAAEPG